MSTVVIEETVRIPDWVRDLDSFRRWTDSDEFPEDGRICYLDGEVWVDMSKEQVFSHTQVKGEFTFTLTGVSKANRLGRYLPEGVYLSHVGANLSVKPDGTFVSRESLRSGRVRLVKGAEAGFVELEGTPDMVLEVISRSSVQKDTVRLLDLYWQAGIPEYWLVDARGQELSFQILRHTVKGYVPVRKQAGWQKSAVFGKSFKLTVQQGDDGYPEYALSVR